MTRRLISLAWLASILFLTVLAGLSWVDLLLTPASGGQKIEVTGYLVFPIISALMLLQGASLLAAVFTPALIARVISGVQVPVLVWHAVVVLTTVDTSLQEAVSSEITEATGVVGAVSQAQLVELALQNNIWYVYLAVLVLNIAVLVAATLVKVNPAKAKIVVSDQDDSNEIWESQR